MNIRPLGTNYLVEMVEPEEKTSGGIYLPDSAQENWSDAIILRVGCGLLLPMELGLDTELEFCYRSHMQCYEFERIVFQHTDYRPFHTGSRRGMVADENVMAVVADGDIYPMNDWVLVELDDFAPAAGLVALPEQCRQRGNHGIARAVGPGQLSRRCQNYGQRTPVWRTMNLAVDGEILGQRVHWGSPDVAFEIGSEHVQGVLVRADDLLFWEAVEE